MKKKLVSLRDKLNNISKSNRSIRLLKKYNKWTFDLSELHKNAQDPLEILEKLRSNQGQTIVTARSSDDVSMQQSKKLTSLYRNIKSIEEETGLYELYLGYPFIEGCLADGTYIRAPLFLYPVELKRVKKADIQWDALPVNDQQPQVNRTFFLAFQKINEIYFPDDFFDQVEELAQEDNPEGILEFLQGYHFNISDNRTEYLEQIEDYKRDEIPVFNRNSFRLNNQAVIGHFPQGDSAILKDYNEFIDLVEEDQDLGKVSDFLNLQAMTTDFNSDQLPSDKPFIEQVNHEKSKFLVLDTDASQEKIIDILEEQDGLVVHGPPGTGKSQVIVNMIANAMAKGERVMLVTQKRAALDVVYERLDALQLSNHVALLHDEKNDRKSLYSKINSNLNQSNQLEDIYYEHESLSDQIIRTEDEMNQVTKAIFTPQEHGYRAYDLYGFSKPYKDQETIIDVKSILKSINKSNIDDILADVATYANYFETFDGNNNPVSDRKPFHETTLADRMALIEILQKSIDHSREITNYLDHFEDEEITPAYSLSIDKKVEKIYDDLNTNEQRTLQKLRLWLWTSFTGKTIIEDLLDGDKFRGLNSKEWPKLRENISFLYELSQGSSELLEEMQNLSKYFQDESIKRFEKRISKGDIPLIDFQKRLDYIKEYFDKLREMDQFYQSREKHVQFIINALIEKVPKAHSLQKAWVDITKQSIYIHWIDEIEAKHPELVKIGNGSFQQLQNKLETLLKEKKNITIKLLQNELNQKIEKVRRQNVKAFKGMSHQTNKKRKLWKVRKFVNEFSLDGLLDIMPVWLVSPEVSSAIFPLEENLFDLVIFDEASQCTVENGIPAIYRGQKVVVAGDEQQLPPTNLFKSTVDIDDELDEDELDEFEESESLLNLAKRILPNQMLEWHYRSKSEELINFSNHAFYNGSMQIAPNVNHLQNPPAIQWHSSDGRWINQRNTVEAEDVVKLLKQLLIQDHNKTIGIITFNAKQQEVIEDVIDKYTEEDPEFGVIYEEVMSRDLDERIFVKNIENVQGDERDIIIFSIAYAKNAEGRVYNRFGTLGQQGGENRLNVAVTRAKEAIHIVSSINPNELDVTNTKNLGPKLLKHYLKYAYEVSNLNKEKIEYVISEINTETNTKTQQTTLHFDSPFEEQVYNQLRNIGYQVNTQIGMSGYRIDLAVVDPNDSSKYVLGIECDGEMYHSAPSARERDIYRQRYLESKGWTIERIWSRNWWNDPQAEIERIDQTIKTLSKSQAPTAN
ncbi:MULTISPECIES: AAA domain-containing protein [Allobacillus]|uniref:AAA domain-containing protein n=1 Tax=Allobacillus TaxID=1400133 RepID=UPI001642881E|nr:AAA domain-containing protein [Allobacillus salarius]